MRNFMSRAAAGIRNLFDITGVANKDDPLSRHYDVLEKHYLSNGVYEALAGYSQETEDADLIPLKSLRNPAPQSVDFFAAKLNFAKWLDEDVIKFGDEAKSRSENITKCLKAVYKWSNWIQEGRSVTRQYGWAGDFFGKVSTREGEELDEDGLPVITAVFYENIDPRHVRDFDKDDRGFFTYLRISVPKTSRNPEDKSEITEYIQTEIWDKETGLYSRYEHEDDELGDPVEEIALETTPNPDDPDEEFTGFNFIPVVHAQFRDVGRDRGLSCFGHALGDIRESDRIATKLHEMLFPDQLWTLERAGLGPDGNPLPPIKLEDNTRIFSDRLPEGNRWNRGYGREGFTAEDNSVRVGKSKIAKLPSGATLTPKIPQRDLATPAAALAEQVRWIEQKLPELSYARLRELQLSGRAIRNVLADVYDRYTEAFDNLAAAMVRLNQMALTIGQAAGLEGFEVESIGEYGVDGLEWEHTFEAPDPFPISEGDEAETKAAKTETLVKWDTLGLLEEGLKLMGYSDADAKRLAKESQENKKAAQPAPLQTDDGEPVEGDEDEQARAERLLNGLRGRNGDNTGDSGSTASGAAGNGAGTTGSATNSGTSG